jgi:phospholipid/cholesterol/gamma-HCH transport system ATP-binding protein
MGGNGCGKSTLLKFLIGLKPPVNGRVFYDGVDFWGSEPKERNLILRRVGFSIRRMPCGVP